MLLPFRRLFQNGGHILPSFGKQLLFQEITIGIDLKHFRRGDSHSGNKNQYGIPVLASESEGGLLSVHSFHLDIQKENIMF